MNYLVRIKTKYLNKMDGVYSTEEEAAERAKYINFKSVLMGIPHTAIIEKTRKKVTKNY